MNRRGVIVGALLAAVVTMTGCSQVSALAPVGGNGLTEARFGAIDVLLSNNVSVLTAPVCTQSGAAISCSGTTTTGDPIAATSSTAADAQLTVTVGGKQLYSGPLQSVLDQAAQK